jgi:hypothetical protein
MLVSTVVHGRQSGTPEEEPAEGGGGAKKAAAGAVQGGKWLGLVHVVSGLRLIC